MSTKRDVIKSAPTLLHTVALVAPTRAETIDNIRRLDVAAPPSLYGPARDLFHAVLRGESFDWAFVQAKCLPNKAERRCALEVLQYLERYLRSFKPTWFRSLDLEPYQLAPDIQIPVRVDGLMRVGDETKLVCLHPWQKRLSVEQMRAAIAVLANRLFERSELIDAKLELLDISHHPITNVRTFRSVGWGTYSQMSAYELEAFMGRLLDAWTAYHANPAPKPTPRPRRPEGGQGDMFDNQPPKKD